jgi:glycosyltransferase involved in cell wall biosynthesis
MHRNLRANVCSNKDDVLIAIPVYNEYEYIDEILRAVHRYASHIIVVDDGSTDGTSALLDKYDFITVVSHVKNIGYGQSLIDAFDYANKNFFKWLITMDGDHQHEPSYLPFFYAEIKKTKADIISGSRYLQTTNNDSLQPPKDRIIINKQITRMLNSRLGANLTDSFCGFKAYKVKSITNLKLTEKGYGFPLQLWIRAIRAALTICEIPVPLIYHDPNRKFTGLLENPHIRFSYYQSIIKRELARNVHQIAETIKTT